MFGFFWIFFPPKIKPYPGQITFWKYNAKSIFLILFFKYWPKLFKKKIRIEIWCFSFRICGFSVRPLPEVKNLFKADLKWETSYFYSKFLCGEFQPIFKKSNNRFPIVFSKSDLARVRFCIWRGKNSEKAKHPRICPCFGGKTCRKLNSDTYL